MNTSMSVCAVKLAKRLNVYLPAHTHTAACHFLLLFTVNMPFSEGKRALTFCRFNWIECNGVRWNWIAKRINYATQQQKSQQQHRPAKDEFLFIYYCTLYSKIWLIVMEIGNTFHVVAAAVVWNSKRYATKVSLAR